MASTSGFPANRLLEIVFSFDTTGSMSSILDEVRGRLQDMIQRLQSDIQGIKIGVIAHGDYCDKDVFYLTKEIDLCQNVAELCQFVQDIEGTGGGDVDECYELVLRLVRQNMSWTPVSQKILVMIGDANPHEPNYELNTDRIDWRDELVMMKHMGIKVYGVQVFSNTGVDEFYKSLATETDGNYLQLTEFPNICDMMMAICYAERGEDFLMNYENEVRSRFGTTSTVPDDIEGMFGALRRDDSLKSISSATHETAPVAPSALPLVASLTPAKIAKVKPTQRKRKVDAKETDIDDDVKGVVKIRRTTHISKDDKFRERISTKKFDNVCGCKAKSKWQLIYTSENPQSRVFRARCLKNKNRYWKKNIAFPKMVNDKGVYEIAVQAKACKRLQTVYNRVCASRKSKLMQSNKWEDILFKSKSQKRKVMSMIGDVSANKGCRVFLRRLKYSKKTISAINDIDYAWQHTKARQIVNNGVAMYGTVEKM